MIAVTGANGLLGSFIVRQLVEKGEAVVAIVRANSSRTMLKDIESKITWRYADIRDTIVLGEALEGVTTVIHAAAMVSFNPRDQRTLYEINVEGTRNMIDVCLSKGIQRFVHISSVAALGRQKGQATVDETNAWVNSPLNSSYAESKYQAELEVFRGQEEGLSTVIINPSLILAPAEWNRSSARVFKYVWEQRKFYIDGYLNYVDVRDVADASIRMITAPVQGERYIVNAGAMAYKEFFDAIGKHFNKRPPSIKLSRNLLYVLARLEGIRARLFGAEPLITTETARLADSSFFYENSKIRKTLNFDFKSIDSSLKWCTDEFRKLALAKI